MTAKERAAREEMSDVEPRRPKTEPWTAEEIIDVAVREIISEVDRLVFEEEASDVTM